MASYKVEICGVNTAKLPILKEEEKDALFARIKQGDNAARETYIKGNLRLVLSVIKRFSGNHENVDDLFQIGCIGLIKAIDRFDVQFQVKFSTYAVPMITGEIKRFLRDDGMIKVSRTLKEQSYKVRRTAEKISQENGRNATLEEVAAATELSREEIVLALEANTEVDSIYRTIFESEGRAVTMADQVVFDKTTSLGYAGNNVSSQNTIGENGVSADYEKEELLNHMLLEQLLKELDATSRKLIEYRYFHDMTQMQVAKQLGISQVQVSRMEKKILTQMRKKAQL